MSELGHDPVNSPSHYASGAVECIDAMQASMTAEQFVGYCKGNAMKYLWRFDQKGNAKQDLEKAAWYLDRLQRAVAIRDVVDAETITTRYYRLSKDDIIREGDVFWDASNDIVVANGCIGDRVGDCLVDWWRRLPCG